MQQKLHRLSVRITSRLQAMADRGQLPPQLVRTKELLQLTEFEEQVTRFEIVATTPLDNKRDFSSVTPQPNALSPALTPSRSLYTLPANQYPQ